MISEMVDIAIATYVFLGKRVLQFDSPDKDPEAKHSIYEPVLPSVNHDFEDDDASEWSLYVNLGSPEVEKEGSAERALDFSGNNDCTVRLLAFEKHVQKMQQEPSMSKVDLLWDQRETHEYNEENTDENGDRYRSLQVAEAEAEEEEEEEAEEEEAERRRRRQEHDERPFSAV